MQIQFPKVQPQGVTHDLIIKPIQESHRDEYFLLNSDPIVMKSYGVLPHQNPSETTTLIQNLNEGYRTKTQVRWGIFLNNDPETLIGDVGFWRFIPIRCRAEVGAKLIRKHHGHGYMKQALDKVIGFGFDFFQINSVEGYIDPMNIASLKLIEKLGFKKIGLIEENAYDYETKKFHDSILVSLAKSQRK